MTVFLVVAAVLGWSLAIALLIGRSIATAEARTEAEMLRAQLEHALATVGDAARAELARRRRPW